MHPRVRATVEDLYQVPDNGKAEREMAEKRADYFAAGTLVVCDVDVLRERVVRVYRAEDPETPALPGWTMLVDDLLP